jgi:hypothetical protein
MVSDHFLRAGSLQGRLLIHSIDINSCRMLDIRGGFYSLSRYLVAIKTECSVLG